MGGLVKFLEKTVEKHFGFPTANWNERMNESNRHN